MFNFVGNLISTISANSTSFSASFFDVIFAVVGKTIGSIILRIFALIWNFVATYIWFIVRFVLTALDAMQMVFNKFLGIGGDFDSYVSGFTKIDFNGGSFFDVLIRIFRAVAIVAIILMIIFTIFAMIMQEYKMMTLGMDKANNDKIKLVKILFTNIIIIILMPLIFYTSIAGTNAILTSFNNALGVGDATLASQVLASATYDANRYRTYANANKRVPITISVYETQNMFGKTLTDDELKANIRNTESQEKLKAIAGAFVEDSFLPFEKSTVYSNGRWESYKNYSLSYNNTEYDDIGRYFENFICTREQYYVLADFIDYCELYNIQYYIKAVSESDICWKYVDGISGQIDGDGNAYGDITLNITYRDAEQVNAPTAYASAAGNDETTYNLQLTTKLDLTSPISDALETASTLLGVNDKTGQFNAMERDSSGEFTNLVSWSTEKVLLKLSNSFNIDSSLKDNNTNGWTRSDEVIIYEYYHFDTNNTLGGYTLEQLKSEGAKLDAIELTYRNYNYYTRTYSSPHTEYCVKINGSYYRVTKSDTLFDDYGHAYYVLDFKDNSTNYFDSLITITSSGTKNLKFSSGFNINDYTTWTVCDQVLIYEYFKDLTLSNGIRRDYQLSNFDKNGSGVTFNKYSIGGTSYVYINGTYYQEDALTSNAKPGNGGSFLQTLASAQETTFYYKLTSEQKARYGVDSLSSLLSSPASFEAIDSSNALYSKYTGNNFKLTEDFSYQNSASWTYRDYALFYIYVNLKDKGTTLDSLKYIGLRGDVGKSGSNYYLKVNTINTETNENVVKYVNLTALENTAELKIMETISPDLFDNLSLGTTNTGLIRAYEETNVNDILAGANALDSLDTHMFYLSETFDRYDAQTWTVGDFFLICLTEQDIIDTNIENLRRTGYSSVVYNCGTYGLYYRFGGRNDTNAYYISANQLSSKGYTVDQWFNTKLIAYLLDQEGYESSDLMYSEVDFMGGVVGNISAFVFNALNSSGEPDFTDPRSIFVKFAQDIISKYRFEGEIEDLKYIYYNPKIVTDDLSTWTQTDLYIFLETGRICSESNPYETYLVKNGSNYYIIVGDKLVQFSSGTPVSNVIRSTAMHSFSAEWELNNYYDERLAGMVRTSDFGSLVGSIKYYSSVLIGSTGNATFVANQSYTTFDLLMIKCGASLDGNGMYTLDLYKKDDDYFVKIGTNYVAISTSESAIIYFVQNAAIPTSSIAFTKNGTYTAFGETVNKFDALIYSLTGSSEQREYQKFKRSSADYILVGNKIIMYDTALAEGENATDFPAYDAENLYKAYYKNYVLNSTDGAPGNVVYSNTITVPTEQCGLRVIFDAVNIGSANALIRGYAGGYYLGTSGGYYVNLTGLVDVVLTQSGGQISGVTLHAIDQNEVLWRLRNLNGENPRTATEISSDGVVSTSNLDAFGFEVTEEKKTIYTSGVKSINDGNINKIGLVYNYFYRETAAENKPVKLMKYYYNGTEYLIYSSVASSLIMPINIDADLLGTGTNPGVPANDTTLKSILDQYFYQSNLKKFNISEFGGAPVWFFWTPAGVKAVYNITEAQATIPTNLQYKMVDTTTPTPTIAETTNISEASLFELRTLPMDRVLEWKNVDFFMSYATFANSGTVANSIVYVNGTKHYIKYEDKYILLAKNNRTFEPGDPENGTQNTITYTGSSIFGKMGNDNLIVSYSSMLSEIKGKIDTGNNKIKTADSGSLTLTRFSSGFDAADYSTWTYSDYIIYYAFSSGFYKSSVSAPFSFTYTPTYSYDGDTEADPEVIGRFYGITYLDVALKAAGKNLKEIQDHYNLNLCFNGNGWYLNCGSGIYAIIGDEIYVDFSDMSVHSNVTGKIYEGAVGGFDADIELFKRPNDAAVGEYYIAQGISKTDYAMSFNSTQFQTFVNGGGAPTRVYTLYKEDPYTGSTTIDKVIDFSSNAKGKTGIYFIYDKFYDLYEKSIYGSLETIQVDILDITTTNPGDAISMKVKYKTVSPDLSFGNYYYFVLDTATLSASGLMDVAEADQASIKQNSSSIAEKKKTLDLKLSQNAADFPINTPSSWTVLDYIILYEFSRDVRHNKFAGLEFSELSDDYFVTIYDLDDDKKILYINGNFYNLAGYINWVDADSVYVSDTTKKLNAAPFAGLVDTTGASAWAYDFKVLKETWEFAFKDGFVNGDSPKARQITRTGNNISYTIDTTTYFRELDTNVIYTNFKVNTADYAKYTTQTIIKKVSWVEKLMTDMQVYYPDLNWEVLVATDGWLDTLGDFTSAYTSGLYVSDNNSANTTAAGLVLSEFFMSVATPVEYSYADYEYGSIFDEETIKSLMLSIMGEENYAALVLEAEVFMDFFNSCYAPILDDFAAEFGEEIGSNSLRICAYKSYLATLLLSSDVGEYLYTLATRVYAEYTIGESLARAGGDYTNYYLFANGLTNEDGKEVNSYNYGTFDELVKYENQYCGKYNPTFTFNFEKAFNMYAEEEDPETHVKKLSGITYATAKDNPTMYKSAVNIILGKMYSDYYNVYRKGYYISEAGRVVDPKTGEVIEESSNEEYVYSYMVHVLYAIRQSIGMIKPKIMWPVYLQNYDDYLNGNLSRWNLISDIDETGVDQYFSSYSADKTSLTLYKTLTAALSFRLLLPQMALSDEMSFLEKAALVVNALNVFGNNNARLKTTIIPIENAYDIFKNNPINKADVEFVKNNMLAIMFRMSWSEDSSFAIVDALREVVKDWIPGDNSTETSWKIINQYKTSLDNIIDELKLLRRKLPNESTPNGSTRQILDTNLKYTDAQLDKIISQFQDVQNMVKKYITTQLRLDKLQKRSITFTLAQYGANYVSTGYEFSIKNKSYVFRSTVDPSRLAEYVYGGSFLESVGVGAQYTSAEFDGIIKARKVYDPVDKVVKTDLNAWAELRGFASKLADTTAELYFMTNLGDLDISKKNAVTIEDCGIKSAIVTYVKNQGYLGSGADGTIFARVGGSFTSLAGYLLSYDYSEAELTGITFEDFKRMILQKVIENKVESDMSAEERAAKYMAMFDLLSAQCDFTYESTPVGRIIPKANIEGGTYQNKVQIHSAEAGEEDIVENYASYGLTAEISHSRNTEEVIKILSDLENRPTLEAVTKQYAGNKPTEYYDEADGDNFIICTYKNGLYYPFLASGARGCESVNYKTFYNDILDVKPFYSEYNNTGAYVIAAKGIITANGYPTAIRKYNNPIEIENFSLFGDNKKTYNAVTFYRTDLTTGLGTGDGYIQSSKAVSRVTTKNYTKYLEGTSFTNGIGSGKSYLGKTNYKTFVTTDVFATYVQSRAEYLIEQSDDAGAINVLDEFSYFYVFGGQSWVLLALAFVTIFPIMINALLAAMRRVLDLMILFIVSPLVVSTNSLYAEGKNPTMVQFIKDFEGTLLSVIGYILAFSAFFILVPMIYNMNTFVSLTTYARITNIAGFGFLTYHVVNAVVRGLWIITTMTFIEILPKMLLPIITSGRTASPDPKLGKEEKMTSKFDQVGQEIKKTMQKFGAIVSGRALIGMGSAVKQELEQTVDNYLGTINPNHKTFEQKRDAANENKAAAEEKLVKDALIAYGVDPKLAGTAGKAVANKEKQQYKSEKERKNKNVKEFQNLFK